MLKNYFKIALRNLWRHRAFSFINIMGLTVGMSACFLIFLYVKFELSYDSIHSKADRIYRVIADIKTPTETLKAGGPGWAVIPNMRPDFPELEAAIRTSGTSMLITMGDKNFQEDHAMFADSGFFQIFDFPLLKGQRTTALKEMMSVVLSETAAKKYFGTDDPLGKTILLTGDKYPATVTGIIKDIPENSIVKADMIISMTTLTRKIRTGNDLDQQWGNYGSQAWLLLKPGVSAAALQAKFPAFLEKRNGTEMKKSQMYAILTMEPLRRVYLYSTRIGNGDTGNINNVYIFSIIAIFILAIACINFINLTTARSTERAKEVGIRKVVGALRTQLARQFIGESVLLCLIAFLLTTGIVALMIPPFNHLAGKTISNGLFEHPAYLAILLLAAIGIGLLAGIYPALVLSSFRPVTVLKGRFATGTKGILLRKSLVVAQFTISIALIIATIVVYNQMNYMHSQYLGFNKDQMMVVRSSGDPAKMAFRQAVETIPGVQSTTMSSSTPGGGNMGAYSQIENVKGEMQIANLDLYFVDYNYIDQYKIKMVAGRSFSKDFQSDTTHSMVLNEAAVKLFGYTSPQQAIGRKFSQWGREGMIIGVMKDFHYHSLQQDIKPLTMRIEPDGSDLVSIKVASSNLPATIAGIESKWKSLIPGKPFSYYFVDEAFDKQYRSEERFGKLFLNFAVLAIFISCLGLLGLASYSTLQRTREIGIRKVMGATVANIVNLLSKDFLKLVLLSFFIAGPVAWYFMHKWLHNFAYRTDFSWWIFLIAGMLALLIAMVTISSQAIRAAVANPAKSLKSE
ncbi:MAG TPA: ABC transporter permease [Puia sp.]|nr:ABC transporter permease [Puia sp.]